MKNSFLIWDLDSTLIPTNMYFEHAKQSFITFIKKEYGWKAPNIEDIVNTLVETDTEQFLANRKNPENALGKLAFHSAMLKAYDKLVDKFDLYEDGLIRLGVGDVGRGPNESYVWKNYGMIDGAEETLQFCKNQGARMHLLTKGDFQVQKQKIEHFGLCRYFDGETIVWNKTLEVFNGIYGNHPRENCYAIGDSTSDFTPCPEATGIHLPQRLWKGQKEEDKNNGGFQQKVYVLNSIKEIKERAEEIFR